MTIKLFNGLINIGGILTETYYRKTRATDTAKKELGLSLTEDYNASIGIASVEEYLVLTKASMAKNSTTVHDLTTYDQAFTVQNVQSSGMESDQFVMTVLNVTGTVLYRRVVNKNLAFYPLSGIYVPPAGKIELLASTAIESVTIVLKPCMVLNNTISSVGVTPTGSSSGSGG